MPSSNDELFREMEHEEPLAARLRPRNLDEFIGQEHIVGRGRLLRRAIQADMLSSVIFSGPPGTGKTTLARVIANTTQSQFLTLNAVLSGVKDVRAAIEKAREHRRLYGRKTILFVDEVHRWNKAQQDALLPWVENGTVILIGATTENPFFEVNSALVSRSRVFQLKALNEGDLRRIAEMALSDESRGYGTYDVKITEEALEHLIRVADGDARSLLNALQLAVETTPSRFPPPENETIHIDLETAEESIQRKAVLYDKEGDYHFDTISAFIKSLRGSDPDAALYWLARMVTAGEDPHYLFRRMLVLASEDVGMADPNALVVVEAAARAFDRVGMPEGQYHLAHATIYLASAPKSNSALGYFDAVSAVETEAASEVPAHLRDPNRDREGFGHGKGYLYPHAYRDHWVAQDYLPAGLQGRIFYQPTDQGAEASIRARVERQRELQLAAMTERDPAEEVLTFSRSSERQSRWLRRAEQERNRFLQETRERIVRSAQLQRHALALIGGSHPQLLLWETLRSVPEGQVYAAVPDDQDRKRIEHYASQMSWLEQPAVYAEGLEELAGRILAGATGTAVPWEEPAGELPHGLDALLWRNFLYRRADKAELLRTVRGILRAGGRLSCAEPVPRHGQRLGMFLSGKDGSSSQAERGEPHYGEKHYGEAAPAAGQSGETEFRTKLEAIEESLYEDEANPLFNWDAEKLEELCREAGFADVEYETAIREEQRTVREEDLRRWFFDESNAYAAAVRCTLSDQEAHELYDLLRVRIAERAVPWKTEYVFLVATG